MGKCKRDRKARVIEGRTAVYMLVGATRQTARRSQSVPGPTLPPFFR